MRFGTLSSKLPQLEPVKPGPLQKFTNFSIFNFNYLPNAQKLF